MKLLLIQTCQRIVQGRRLGPGLYEGGRPRLCGEPSVAVLRRDDGQEHFLCVEHTAAESIEAAGAWHLHRRPPLPTPQAPPKAARPKRQMSEEGRARIAAGQRARWARHRQSQGTDGRFEQRESA